MEPVSHYGHPEVITNAPYRSAPPGSEAAPLAIRRQLSGASILRISLDAIIAVSSLAAVAGYYRQPFEGPYLILALIVFSLTFPGAIYSAASWLSLAREVLVNWAIVLLILLFFGYASGYLSTFPSRVVLAWSLMVPALLFVSHAAIPAVLPRLLAMEGLQRRAIIAGANELSARLAAQVKAAPLMGIELAGVFDDRRADRQVSLEGVPLLGKLESIGEYCRTHRVDLIYITLPMASQPRILELLGMLRDTTASIYFVPDIFMFDLIQARVDIINGIPVVAVCETPFYGFNGLIKNVSDYVLAIAALVLTAPLMLSIALAVKLSSPGPILFRQRRYGLDGREITVYKFRTMKVLEDGAQVRQARPDDERITRIGRFLRRTSLDELPQFINVLQGRMSVVGPRPHAVAHNEQYRKLIDGYMVRHKVKPGITGWAQVNGLRGETDTVEKMGQRIEYDLAYLRNWSLRLDLQIIAKTALLVFYDKRAY
jgi:putative colanic acid biosynthesis UDP-glucose lipid carrier transferase